MSSVILQPAGGTAARQHFEATVAHPVALDDHHDTLGPHYVELLARFPSGFVPMWGVTPGGNDRNTKLYNRLAVGDLVLFAGNGAFFAAGTIAYMWHDPGTAERLWGRDPNGHTWEWMYALDDARSLNLSYQDFNRTVGYQDNAIPQDFRILDQDKSERVFAFLIPASDRRTPEVSLEEFSQVDLDGDLDRQVVARARTEQGFLRRILFGSGPLHRCDICGEILPTELLIAAHIKRRASCTDEERRDVPANIMAACALGCDDLFERGYICVDDSGDVRISTEVASEATALHQQLDTLRGRRCSRFAPANHQYFRWHRDHIFRKAPALNV